MKTRWWRMVRLMVTMLSLTMLVGLAGPASAQDTDPKDDCKQGGWETLTTAEGEAFDNQGNCVSYVAADGGVPVSPPQVQLVFDGSDGRCSYDVVGTGFDAGTSYYIKGYFITESWPDGVWDDYAVYTADGAGAFNHLWYTTWTADYGYWVEVYLADGSYASTGDVIATSPIVHCAGGQPS